MTDPIAIEALLALPPKEAIAYFRDKGFLETFAWQDAWQSDHAKSFTVAKAMSQELLEAIRGSMDDALAKGLTLDTFRSELQPLLEQLGWWGKASDTDPLTGHDVEVQLGSPQRLRVIFDTNLRTAYAAGRWQRAIANAGNRPFMRYVAVMDRRTRPEHRAWHGTILPIENSWWGTHFPPCGWGCRCTTTTLDQRTIDRRGWKVTEKPVTFAKRHYRNPRTGETSEVPGGIDPGWAYNVGEAYLAPTMPRPIAPDAGTATTASQPAHIDTPEAGLAIAGFLAAFGLKPGEEKVFVDAGGWPLAIGAGLFLDAAGRFDPPPPERFEALAAAGRVIAHPAQIRWAFIDGPDGRAQLVRRYIGNAGRFGVVADWGRAGWRFTTPAERGRDDLSGGKVVWPAEADAVPSSN